MVTIAIVGGLGLCVMRAQAAGRQPKARSDAASPEPGTEAVKAKEDAAKKACLLGDPAKGIELLTELFIESDDPNHIFNQGRCYEQSSRYEDAIERFREYLRKAKTASSAERAEAEEHIAECKAMLLEGKAQASTPKSHGDIEPSAPETGADPLTPAGSEVERSTLVQGAPAGTPALAGSGLRAGGIVVAAAGLAAVGSGVILNLKHNSIIRDMRENYDQSTHASAGDYRTWAIVGYAAGAACIAGGAIMYALGWKAGRATVVLLASTDGAELAIGGRF